MIAFSLFFSSRRSPPRILLVSLVRRAVVVIVVVASGRRRAPVPSSSRRHRLKALRSFLFVPPREKIESKPSSNPERPFLHLFPVWLFFLLSSVFFLCVAVVVNSKSSFRSDAGSSRVPYLQKRTSRRQAFSLLFIWGKGRSLFFFFPFFYKPNPKHFFIQEKDLYVV